jgi:hypothetical protein
MNDNNIDINKNLVDLRDLYSVFNADEDKIQNENIDTESQVNEVSDEKN